MTCYGIGDSLDQLNVKLDGNKIEYNLYIKLDGSVVHC